MQDRPEQLGHLSRHEVSVVADPPDSDGVRSTIPRPPLSARWISASLLRRTQDVWSRAYGRAVSPDEAVEILINVKHFAEVLQRTTVERSEGP